MKAKAKEGRWIQSENLHSHVGFYCSKCEFFIPWHYPYYKNPIDHIRRYKYCPQCGVKMGYNEEEYKNVKDNDYYEFDF